MSVKGRICEALAACGSGGEQATGNIVQATVALTAPSSTVTLGMPNTTQVIVVARGSLASREVESGVQQRTD